MRTQGLLRSTAKKPFLPQSEKKSHHFSRGYVEDDHIPFMERGVRVLHIIPTPFPPQWHTMDDDAAHLDPPTVDDWAKIIAAFAAEWLELDRFMDAPKQPFAERANPPKDEL